MRDRLQGDDRNGFSGECSKSWKPHKLRLFSRPYERPGTIPLLVAGSRAMNVRVRRSEAKLLQGFTTVRTPTTHSQRSDCVSISEHAGRAQSAKGIP